MCTQYWNTISKQPDTVCGQSSKTQRNESHNWLILLFFIQRGDRNRREHLSLFVENMPRWWVITVYIREKPWKKGMLSIPNLQGNLLRYRIATRKQTQPAITIPFKRGLQTARNKNRKTTNISNSRTSKTEKHRGNA